MESDATLSSTGSLRAIQNPILAAFPLHCPACCVRASSRDAMHDALAFGHLSHFVIMHLSLLSFSIKALSSLLFLSHATKTARYDTHALFTRLTHSDMLPITLLCFFSLSLFTYASPTSDKFARNQVDTRMLRHRLHDHPTRSVRQSSAIPCCADCWASLLQELKSLVRQSVLVKVPCTIRSSKHVVSPLKSVSSL